MDNSQQTPSLAAFMATSITSQALGGALAVVYLAYNHLPPPGNGIDPKSIEDALTIIFSTGVSIVAMITHLLVIWLKAKLTPKT